MKRLIALAFLFACAATAYAGPLQEKNKAIARRVFDEIYNQNRFQTAAEIYAPDFVNHGFKSDIDLKVDQDAARGWKSAFPDLKVSVVLTVAEGDLVTVLWTASGTNTGQGNGLPATGKKVAGRGITIWRIVNGKIREEWSEFDNLRIQQQLGLTPTP